VQQQTNNDMDINTTHTHTHRPTRTYKYIMDGVPWGIDYIVILGHLEYADKHFTDLIRSGPFCWKELHGFLLFIMQMQMMEHELSFYSGTFNGQSYNIQWNIQYRNWEWCMFHNYSSSWFITELYRSMRAFDVIISDHQHVSNAHVYFIHFRTQK